MADYFVIDGRDGTPIISQYSKRELLEMIQNEDYKGVEFITDLGERKWDQVCEFGDNAIVIIRGSITVPQQKKEIIVWEI